MARINASFRGGRTGQTGSTGMNLQRWEFLWRHYRRARFILHQRRARFEVIHSGEINYPFPDVNPVKGTRMRRSELLSRRDPFARDTWKLANNRSFAARYLSRKISDSAPFSFVYSRGASRFRLVKHQNSARVHLRRDLMSLYK